MARICSTLLHAENTVDKLKKKLACMKAEVFQEYFFPFKPQKVVFFSLIFYYYMIMVICCDSISSVSLDIRHHLWWCFELVTNCKSLTHHCILHPPGLVCHLCQCRLSHWSIFIYKAIFGKSFHPALVSILNRNVDIWWLLFCSKTWN